MKNFYDELEVSKTASQEIINKAYKVLAKKYHPDTTKEENKQAAEDRFKKISTAYETLSNPESRKAYDQQLEQSNPQVSMDDYQRLINTNEILKQELMSLKSKLNSMNSSTHYQNNPPVNTYHTYQQPSQRPQTVYRKATPFEIFRYKVQKFFKNILAAFLTFALLSLILFVLLKIPSTRNWLLNDMGFGFLLRFFH